MAASNSSCSLTCDYLVVGAGATGLAFTDSLLKRTQASGKRVSIVIVDERDQPGGHWNDAYKFCRLDRQSHHYGVSSQKLEKATREGEHRATTNELLAYFGNVMDDLVLTGLVEYYPMHTFDGEHMRSCLDPARVLDVRVQRKIVDTTYLQVQGPSTTNPPFRVTKGAAVVQPSELIALNASRPRGYVIIGAGRTAIDVILWLLSRKGVAAHGSKDEDTIQWIMPRDPWLVRREAIEGDAWASTSENHHMAIMKSQNVDELCMELEGFDLMTRVDPTHAASQFHGTTVSRSEVEQLRRVKRIIRLGKVKAVHSDQIILEKGTFAMPAGTLVINCASQWIGNRPAPVPIWQHRRMVVQPVGEVMVGAGEFNVTFSASLLGTVEALLPNKPDKQKNEMCTAVQWPDTIQDWLRLHVIQLKNKKLWEDPRMRSLLCTDRLSYFSNMSMDGLRQLSNPKRELLRQRVGPKIEALLEAQDWDGEHKPSFASWSSTTTASSADEQ